MVAVGEYINILIERNNNKATTLTVTEKVKLNWLSNLHRTLSLIDETWDKCEYICQREGKTVKLTPFKVDTLSKYIFDHADNVLLMSATIVDHKNYAKSLGITEYKFIEVDSTFDAKKAPIYVSTGSKLNHANMEKMLPKLVDQIESICESHKNDKGMIHTHTMQITQYLQKKLKSSRFLYRDSQSKNETIIDNHFKSKEATVIVSPSMTHGVDLKDDLARFQIIIKAGYLPLSDLRIKRLFDEDKIWYTNKMLGNLVQACGRGIRSQDDHCVTYILDGAIYEAIINNKNKLPKYFLDRFV
jgi:Rad3-related DNA helicase